MPPPPGDDTRDESLTGGDSPDIIIAPLLSDEDVAPGQTNAASGNASGASSDPAPGPSDATTSGAAAGEPAGGDGDRPRGVPWRRPIPSFFAVGPRGELMPHFLPPGVDFNNPAESGPFGNDMENMMPLAPFLDFLINRIGGQATSRPDPEAAAELLRSLDDVKSPMFRRVNRVIVAEQAQEGLEQDEDEKGWKCGICLEGIEDDVKEIGIKGLPCNHLFHESCLRPWFETKHTCPTCRLDLDPMKTLRHPQRPAATRPPPTGADRTAQHPYARDGPRPSNRPAANTENADNPSGNTGTPPAAGPPADQPSISFFWRMPNPAPSTNGTFSAPAPSRNAAEAAPEDTGSTTPPGEPSQSSVRAEQTPSGNDAAPPAPSTAGAQGASTSARNSDGNTRNPAPPHRGPQITVIHTGGGPPHLPGMPGFPTPPTSRPPGTAQSGGVPWPLSFPLPPFPRPPAGSTPPVSSEAATDPLGNTSATTTTNSADAEGSRDAGNASTGRAIPTSNNDSTPESENQRSRSTNSDNGQALAEAPDTESRPTPHFHFIFNFTGGHEGGPPGIPSVGIPPPREAGARADSEPPPLIPAQTEGVEPPAPERAPERAPARAPERESLETWVSKREKVLGWRCDAPICQLAPGNDDGEDDFNFDDIEPREKQLLSINSPLQPGPNASTGSAEDDESEPASKKRKFEIHGCEHRWHRQCIETSERAAARPLKVDGEGRVWVKCEKCRKDGWVMPRAERSRSNSEFEVERLVAEGRV